MKEASLETFTKRLNEMIKEKGISQRELADRAHVTEVSMSRYVNGARPPRIDAMGRMEQALDTTMDYLCGISDEKEKRESHGHWNKVLGISGNVEIECSECGNSIEQFEGSFYGYCPYCGIKMDMKH